MSRIALVTDSSANMPLELVEQHGMHVIPLYVHFGEESYRDGVDMDTATFYEQLRSAPKLPTTSQPSVGDFMGLYRRLGQDADAIISIHISSGLSGTVDSALAARQELLAETENPPDVYVIDSRVTASGLALLVTAAARAIAADLPADRVVQKVQDLALRLSTIFVMDTLEYLHKGGRIGGAAALMGSVLQIKPILHLREGL